MRNFDLRQVSIVIVVALAGACSVGDTGLSAFSSDGCSLFPDRSLITAADWCSCCFEHDVAYWRGGTASDGTLVVRCPTKCRSVMPSCPIASTSSTPG